MKWSWELFPTTPKAKRAYYFMLILGIANVIIYFVQDDDFVLGDYVGIIGAGVIIWGLIGLNKLQRKKQQEPENS